MTRVKGRPELVLALMSALAGGFLPRGPAPWWQPGGPGWAQACQAGGRGCSEHVRGGHDGCNAWFRVRGQGFCGMVGALYTHVCVCVCWQEAGLFPFPGAADKGD